MVHVRHSQPSIGARWSPGTLRGSDAMPPRSFVALHRRRSCGGEEDVGGSATLDRSPDVLGTLPTRSASRGALPADCTEKRTRRRSCAACMQCRLCNAERSSLESQHPQCHAWRSWRSAKLCTFFASPAPAEAYVTRTEKDETQKSYLYTRFTFCRMPLLRSRSPHCVAP